MTYQALTDHLQKADPNYYITLLKHAQVILDETVRTKKHIIAEEIGLQATQLSLVLSLLEAHRDIVNTKSH